MKAKMRKVSIGFLFFSEDPTDACFSPAVPPPGETNSSVGSAEFFKAVRPARVPAPIDPRCTS